MNVCIIIFIKNIILVQIMYFIIHFISTIIVYTTKNYNNIKHTEGENNMMNINAFQTFNNTISHFFTNLGSYSLIKEVNSDSYYQLNYQINNISLRIKNGQLPKDHLEELYDELLEIKIANDYVKYIIEENNTLTNLTFGLELQKLSVQLLDLIVSYYMEDKISQREYETKLSYIHDKLIEHEQYFNHHILKDDFEHEKHVKNLLTDIDESSLVSMGESEFLGELEKW